MTLFEYIGLALGNLRENKVRSCLTMLAVIIGVMAVVVLVSLGEAARGYVENEFAALGSNLLQITPGRFETATGLGPPIAGSFRKLTNQNAKEIRRRARGVDKVAPMVLASSSVRHEARQRNTMVFGITEDYGAIRDIHAQIGRLITRQDEEKRSAVCVLGKMVKEELYGTRNPLYEKVTINRRQFRVVGVLEEEGMTLGINMDDVILIPITVAQQMFHGGEDEVYQIFASARNPEETGLAIASIREILIAAHDYTEDFTILDQASILATFERIFYMLRLLIVGLASISLLVGGIGIMNIMLVSVRERTREIGIRKAVGARPWDIGLQFLIESITLSIAGGIIGTVGGYLCIVFLRTIYPTFPVYCSVWAVPLAFAFSLATGVFFAVYPALKATAVDPVEALRYE